MDHPIRTERLTKHYGERAADPGRTTRGLDPLIQQQFNGLLRELRNEGRTVFLSSHVLDEVEAVADRVGIVRGGRLVAVETVRRTARPDGQEGRDPLRRSPLLLLIFAIGWATRTLAGEEEDGRLELLLANPVARSRVVLEKAAALAAGIVLLAVVSFVVLLILRPVSELTVPVGELVAMHVSLVLLSAVFGALALALAAATGRRGMSTGVSAAVAVLAYLVDSFAPLVEGMERLQPLSPSTAATSRCGTVWTPGTWLHRWCSSVCCSPWPS